VFYQNKREVEQVVWKDHIKRTDINNNNDTTKLQRQHTYCKLINNKNTLTKHREQNTHWAVYNSEITHYECICDENSLKWECKSNDDESTDKKLHTKSVTAKKN